MKKSLFLLCLSLCSFGVMAAVPPVPTIAGKAYLVEDVHSGQILASANLDERIEPASLTKLMTAYLTFQALESGKLKADQMLTVSEKGYKSEGSRMFLDPRVPASVNDLILGMIVQSGNDACVTLAEAIAGSEEAFAVLMNQEAQRLGMSNSHFTNATGLPDAELYTTVRDLATLSRAIQQDFPQHYPIYSVKSFTYNKIKQDNRNLLLYRDPYVDGMKTGYTASAGYNLIASSSRNGRRVLSVVVGTGGEKERADESAKLLGWAIQSFESPKMYGARQEISTAKVYKGADNQTAVGFLQDVYVTVPFGEGKNLKPILQLNEPLIAPITVGQKIGTLSFQDANGQTVATRDVVALNEVKAAGWFGRWWDGMILWFKSLLA
ncbi:MAG: D-alanyl-D-alanine carboxypeptidase family protein [Neisseria sp.]|nr:D-alanyl-D-alanine carboxypeptidase family protein [Neisseria sp.]